MAKSKTNTRKYSVTLKALDMDGWIKLFRAIQTHWIWQNPEYLKAWITILLTVNHEDKKVLIHGELINCARGQSLLSLNSWAKLFGKKWSIQRVRTFFELLKNDSMIDTEGLSKSTRLTVCNYECYQDLQQTNNRQKTFEQQTDNKQITTNKKEKNEKEYKNTLLSEIIISDFPEIKNEYFEIAKAFQLLFKNNLKEAGAQTSQIEKAKGTWIDDVRLIIEKDKYSMDDLREVYRFLQKDQFWKQNILSISKLREQIPKLKLKIHNGENRTDNKEGTTWNQLAEIVYSKFDS